MRNKYNFKVYVPFMQRGQKFPPDIVRVRKSSMVVSANILEEHFSSVRFTNENEQERIRAIINVDPEKKVVRLVPSKQGYVFQCRQNGNGYINTTRLGLGLEVGDYALIKEPGMSLLFGKPSTRRAR